MSVALKAPFPYMGGKSRVSDTVWDALGSVNVYVEPFAGSLAVLLGRPRPFGGREVVNDKSGFIANFWRALAAKPEAVAGFADYPVTETDLYARHVWLVRQAKGLSAGLEADPDWFDVKVAGWWVWGQSAWFGSGWCNGAPTRHMPTSVLQGVHAPGRGNLGAYFTTLAERLRKVTVLAGDWSRCVTDGVLAGEGVKGIFLDPPYTEAEGLVTRHYAHGEKGLGAGVREWCRANGDNPRYRIVLAGYADEHDLPGWRCVAGRAHSSTYAANPEYDGHTRERLWLSPHTIERVPTLFE